MRNNYADNDAEASFYRAVTSGSDQTVKAAEEDQFWVVDWVTISGGGSGSTVQIKFGSDTQWSATIPADGIEHFTFVPPLYANGKTKNEALVVNGTGTTATVCIRYR